MKKNLIIRSGRRPVIARCCGRRHVVASVTPAAEVSGNAGAGT